MASRDSFSLSKSLLTPHCCQKPVRIERRTRPWKPPRKDGVPIRDSAAPPYQCGSWGQIEPSPPLRNPNHWCAIGRTPFRPCAAVLCLLLDWRLPRSSPLHQTPVSKEPDSAPLRNRNGPIFLCGIAIRCPRFRGADPQPDPLRRHLRRAAAASRPVCGSSDPRPSL